MNIDQREFLTYFNRAKELAFELTPGYQRRLKDENGNSYLMSHRTADGKSYVSVDPDMVKKIGFKKPDAYFPHPNGRRPAREVYKDYTILRGS